MIYSTNFFKHRQEQVLASAGPIVEHLFNLIKPETALDIGCATGIWLAQAKKKGAVKIKGIDGPWVPREQLEIRETFFLEHDLSQKIPSDVGFYDLAFCIEVAEHLAPNAADDLIYFLTSHADAILFSAAIPGQGGTGHINEQPQSYWHKKFSDNQFECFDIIRPKFWDDPNINIIYKQNMLLYVRIDSFFHTVLRKSAHASLIVKNKFSLDRIHPELFRKRTKPKPTQSQKIKKKITTLFL
ncbi:methyltransferase domain-containing protein [Chlorobium phaeovibrioides]|uniref:methyltransferase domain-containing protein n=1 Tax=Chlorobium phaeovibrioides TaxID=1094 RepID=UPI0012317155|nr:class I SAM-dependent methyltransferase [Chlorobium phaeovibrioides]QEQ57179.1 class I SAM-dependent methyltransferase [Chlorobium phaeovibrioides]